MKQRRLTLKEVLNSLQELDYMPGVSMDVPDFNYTVNFRRNFDPQYKGGKFPYDNEAEAEDGEAPEKTGQTGIGRGGIGMGGRDDVSGGIRQPSAAYNDTWDTDLSTNEPENEGADWEELQRHGSDKYRNVWTDTPDGKEWTKLNKEAMGSPSVTGPLIPMDGPQHDVLHFSSGSEEGDMLPANSNNGPGNMWGGPSTIPAQNKGWSSSPTLGDTDKTPWRVPEENNMKLREFFDPTPVQAEEIDNPAQDHFEDQGDDELELDPDPLPNPDMMTDPETRTSPEDIGFEPHLGQPTDFVMSPVGFGSARGSYGIHTDGKEPELVDKSSAWDVLCKVVGALDGKLHDEG
jgi:hypothetical protein